MDMKTKYKGGYDFFMEHISVTPEMEERIVAALRRENAKRKDARLYPYGRWLVGLAACAVVAVIGLAILPILQSGTETPGDYTGMPLPPQSYATMEEALSILPFDASVPTAVPEGYALSACTVYDNEMLELTYTSTENKIDYRTAEGNGDISGDYNEYAESKTVMTDSGAAVTLKGDECGWQSAVWTDAGRTYCVYSMLPAQEKDIMLIVNSISPHR